MWKGINVNGLPIACTFTQPELRARQREIAALLFHGIEQTEEFMDSFAFRFPGTDEWVVTLAEFVRCERRCCAFFTFELVFDADWGPIWLRLRGSEAVKDYVRSTSMAAMFPQ